VLTDPTLGFRYGEHQGHAGVRHSAGRTDHHTGVARERKCAHLAAGAGERGDHRRDHGARSIRRRMADYFYAGEHGSDAASATVVFTTTTATRCRCRSVTADRRDFHANIGQRDDCRRRHAGGCHAGASHRHHRDRLSAAGDNGNISGFAIFQSGGQEAVVPMETGSSSAYTLAFDNTAAW